MARTKKIQDYGDAILWLGFFSRFAAGDLAKRATEIAVVLCGLKDDLAEARERCQRLASSLEQAEAREGL